MSKMMEVDLFNFEVKVIEPIERPLCKKNNQTEGELKKWQMFEYLDTLKGSTALFTYQKNNYQFQAPIHIQEYGYAANNFHSISNDFVALCRINGKKSNVTLNSWSDSGMLTKIKRIGQTHCMYYMGKRDKVVQELLSRASFELNSYSNIKTESALQYDQSKGLSQLVGLNVRAELKCEDDMVRSIETMPFKILSIVNEDDSIIIEGTNDFYVRAKGFKGIRQSSSLIIDIRDPDTNHCTHSFNLFVD